jgi:hypothetical protein
VIRPIINVLINLSTRFPYVEALSISNCTKSRRTTVSLTRSLSWTQSLSYLFVTVYTNYDQFEFLKKMGLTSYFIIFLECDTIL